jgi:hypothetical protein
LVLDGLPFYGKEPWQPLLEKPSAKITRRNKNEVDLTYILEDYPMGDFVICCGPEGPKIVRCCFSAIQYLSGYVALSLNRVRNDAGVKAK